ncbi:MAG: peptidylprolyl isomerase [Betaproteobacteria bacterium]
MFIRTRKTLLSCCRYLAPVVILLAAAAAQSQDKSARTARQPVLVDAIVAVVNTDVITMKQLNNRIQIVEQRMRRQNMQLPQREILQKQLLERLIVNRAQMQLARDLGIRVDDAMLDRAVARIAEQNNISVQALRDQLERDGISFARFRDEIREEITLQRLREREVDNKLQITESEIDGFLASSSARNTDALQELSIAQILVRVPENASAQQIAERKKRAEQAIEQLKSGTEFAKVAATFSDAGDALSGGELGWRSPARLPQLFVEAVDKLKDGELAPLVRSANGFHVLKLVGRRVTGGASASASSTVQQTRARHILIKVNQIVSAAEARRKLLELKSRLENNAATFEDLARLYSNDGSASKGGELGWIYPGDTVPEFERAMNSLKPGEISAPIESPFGFHLIEVLERKTEAISRERQRLVARQALREQKLEEAYEDWLRQLRDRAYVEYRLDDAAR